MERELIRELIHIGRTGLSLRAQVSAVVQAFGGACLDGHSCPCIGCVLEVESENMLLR